MSITYFYYGQIMTWSIAHAKQQFSEVVRLSAQEPQAIYNRDKPVAMLVNATEFEEFKQWRRAQSESSLTAQFDELRAALREAGLQGLDIPARATTERPNAFLQMLAQEAASNITPQD